MIGTEQTRGGVIMHHPFFALISSTVLAFSTLSIAMPAAIANHIPGATYSGNVSSGGTMQLTVSGDGSAVSAFSVSNATTGCGTISTDFTGALPITSHAFAKTTGNFRFAGMFPAAKPD